MMISSIVDSVIWAPVFTFLPIFGFFSLNFIGVELENPFGTDPNDLPLDHFQAEMNNCLLMLLQEDADLIPGLSPTRCLKDFTTIRSKCRTSHHDHGDENKKQTLRVSMFTDFVDIDEEEEDDDGLDIFQIPTQNTNDAQDTDAKDKKVAAAETVVATPPKTNGEHALEAEVPKMVLMDQAALMTLSMTAFNAALEELTKATALQASDIGKSINAVKEFQQSLPKLLDSLS